MSLPTSGTCARDFECVREGVAHVFVPTKGTMSVFGTKDELEGGSRAERLQCDLHGQKQEGAMCNVIRRRWWAEELQW